MWVADSVLAMAMAIPWAVVNFGNFVKVHFLQQILIKELCSLNAKENCDFSQETR